MIRITIYLIYLIFTIMLAIKTIPFNPNRKKSAGPIWDKKDVQLTLDNLNSIPAKDINVTGKSLDFYKDANKLDTMAEIISTWNLTQYNILSGVQDVLNSTDRILSITEKRNKLIGQCVKRLNYFQARTDRVDFYLMKTAAAMPEVTLNDVKAQQKRKDIWTIASCQDEVFNEDELNNNTFYNLKLEENINTLQMTDVINNKPNFGPHNKILTISNEVSLVTVTDTANPRRTKIIEKREEKFNTQIIKRNNNVENINKNENELNLKSKTNTIKLNGKLKSKKIKNRNNKKRIKNANLRKKKKSKKKKKYHKYTEVNHDIKTQQQQQKKETQQMSNAEFFAQPGLDVDLAEADRRMEIHLRKLNLYNEQAI